MTSSGSPDPLSDQAKGHSTVAVLDIGVLVFREGLECVLVLSAITASMVGESRKQRRPVAAGAAVGLLATIATWFVAAGIVSDLTESFSALAVQAATGLLAVVVLLIVMNWFFHKVYWAGWISAHNKRKRSLLSKSGAGSTRAGVLWGLGLLGFSSFYREGFEVVLFLQSYTLKLGDAIVLKGVLAGSALTAVVAILTFVAHARLPYRRMLVLTGLLLGIVLLVMVGEEAQEMQLAHWIPTTQISWMQPVVPGWMGLWFSVFPTVETMLAQGLAAALVVGSYWFVRRPPGGHESASETEHGTNTLQTEPSEPLLAQTAAIRGSQPLGD